MKKNLFRYSGNKSRLLQFYRKPPSSIKRVVEPYLGSGSFMISCDVQGLGYELNGDLVAMWNWLKGCTSGDLVDLDKQVRALKGTEEKPDVRKLGLPLGPQTYVRINITGVMVGQLTCWKIYPQHNLPLENTLACLPRLKDIEVVHGSANEYKHTDGDLLFIDPPYLGTYGGYEEKSKSKGHDASYDPKGTLELLNSTNNPVIFTYGTNAPSIFPNFVWEKVKTIKVPNFRRGGTVDRVEWVSYINW
jgi:site-specific DNA-adenine methylase